MLTTWFLSRYQHQPGHFFGKLGLLQVFAGILSFVVGIIEEFTLDKDVMTAVLCAVGLVFCATGVLTVCLGLLAELSLRHFIRIDPAIYIEEQDR